MDARSMHETDCSRMKVWQLAQLAGTSVEEVVAKLVQEAGLPEHSETGRASRARRRSLRSMTAAAYEEEAGPWGEAEPKLGWLVGRATWQELQLVVDRWVLGQVLAACDWNVTHAAKRLDISRRTLRDHWAQVHGAAFGALVVRLTSAEIASGVPAGPSLAKLLEQGATFREIHREVDRWVVERMLANEDGNVTWAARKLGISRRFLREIRDSGARGS